ELCGFSLDEPEPRHGRSEGHWESWSSPRCSPSSAVTTAPNSSCSPTRPASSRLETAGQPRPIAFSSPAQPSQRLVRVQLVHDRVATAAGAQPAVDRDGEDEGDDEAEPEAPPEESVGEAGGHGA